MSPKPYKPPHTKYKAGRKYVPPDSAERRRQRQAEWRFFKSKAWQATRALVLSDNPFCVECEAKGELVLAEEVDHIKSRQERPDLALDLENLQPLCKSCHSSKTARHDGGLGHRRRTP